MGALERLFLERLRRLAELRATGSPDLNAGLRHLLDHALYSTYQDCVQLGPRAEARRMLGWPDHDRPHQGTA